MSNNTRILNITRGFYLKHKQALKAIDEAACEWVEYGVSVRSLSLAESIAKRNLQSAAREPLVNAELAGVIFRMPETKQAQARESIRLSWQANKFFETASA